MTYGDAVNYFQAMQAERSIGSDPSTSFGEKARRMAEFAKLRDRPADQPRRWTVGDVIHGAIGAATGVGMARGLSKLLGLGSRMSDKLETAAMGIGAAMNTGVIKRAADERRHAFEMGFAQGLYRSGYFDKVAVADEPDDTDGLYKRAAMMPIFSFDIGGLAEIPRGIGRAVSGFSRSAGSIAGSATALDEDDEELARIQVERALLEEQLERLKADKRNAALKQVLAKRRTSK